MTVITAKGSKNDTLPWYRGITFDKVAVVNELTIKHMNMLKIKSFSVVFKRPQYLKKIVIKRTNEMLNTKTSTILENSNRKVSLY